MRVCIELITRVGYRCWQPLAIAVGIQRLGYNIPLSVREHAKHLVGDAF